MRAAAAEHFLGVFESGGRVIMLLSILLSRSLRHPFPAVYYWQFIFSRPLSHSKLCLMLHTDTIRNMSSAHLLSQHHGLHICSGLPFYLNVFVNAGRVHAVVSLPDKLCEQNKEAKRQRLTAQEPRWSIRGRGGEIEVNTNWLGMKGWGEEMWKTCWNSRMQEDADSCLTGTECWMSSKTELTACTSPPTFDRIMY